MKARELTVKATRVLGDRHFGNYQVEAAVKWDLEGEERRSERLPDLLQQASALVRARVLAAVAEMRREEEEGVGA